MRHFFVVLLVLSHLGYLTAQVEFQPTFININSTNGLNSSEVYHVGQDSQGYIWICTDAGVTRYDGFYFETFTVKKDGLLDNVIFNFYEDRKGRIWFLSHNSKLCYYENGSIHSYRFNDRITEHISGAILNHKSLYIDGQGTLFYSLEGFGLLKISNDGKTEQIQEEFGTYLLKVEDTRIKSSMAISVQHQIEEGRPKFPDHLPLYYQNDNGEKVRLDVPICLRINRFLDHESGYLLIDNKVLNVASGEILYDGIQANMIGGDSSIFWIATVDGLLMGSINDGGKFDVKSKNLDNISVSDAFWDDQGGCWISTLNKGVFYCNNFSIERAQLKEYLDDESIISTCKVGNNIWLSSLYGFGNLSSGVFYTGENLGSPRVFSIHDKLWVNSLAAQEFSTKYLLGNKFKTYYPISILDMCEDGDNALILDYRVVRYTPKNDWADTISQDYFSSITKTDKGEIILGNKNGLFSLKSGNEIAYFLNSDLSRELSVSDLLFTKELGLIVATKDHGVLVYRDGLLTERLDESKGLHSDRVNCVEFGGNGILYIGTNSGVYYFDELYKKVKRITRNDGLGQDEITTLLSVSDYLYVGTKDGLYRVHHEFILRKPRQLIDYLNTTSVYIDGVKKKLQSSHLPVPYGAGNIHIKFRSKELGNWFHSKYQYRLKGSSNWIEINSPDIILNRPDGDFLIEARYYTANGNWSTPVNLLSINVEVPLWKRWELWLLISILVVTLLFMYYRKRAKLIQSKLQLENDMLSLEQRVHGARMNPHFIFNVLNSIHSCLILNENELANNYLLKFSELMRDYLKAYGESSLSVSEEIKILTKYLELEQLRHSDKFGFKIDSFVSNEELLIPSMLIQPIVENAIVHGVSHNINTKGIINIRFEKINNKIIQVSIVDNGEKINADTSNVFVLKGGHAIDITQSRIKKFNELYKTTIYSIEADRKVKDSRTIVVLNIPVLL